MKRWFLMLFAVCLCLTALVSCAEVDAREDKMEERKTFSSKEEMIDYLSGKESRERGISSAGEWSYTPENTMDSYLAKRCSYLFDEKGNVTYYEKTDEKKTDLTDLVTFVPAKGYVILPDGVKLYCEGISITEQKDSDKSGTEAREFVACF